MNIQLDKAISLYKLGKIEEAELIYNSLIEKKESLPQVFYYLSLVKNKQDKKEESKALLQNSIQLDSSFYLAQYNLGYLMLESKDFKLAKELFLATIAIRPDFLPAYINLAYIYTTENNLENAIINYLKIIELNPTDSENYNNLSDLLIKLSRNIKTERLIEKAYKTLKLDFNTSINLVKSYIRNNKFQEANKLLQELSFSNDNNALVHYYCGIVNTKLNNIDNSILNYIKSINLDDNLIEPYISISKILINFIESIKNQAFLSNIVKIFENKYSEVDLINKLADFETNNNYLDLFYDFYNLVTKYTKEDFSEKENEAIYLRIFLIQILFEQNLFLFKSLLEKQEHYLAYFNIACLYSYWGDLDTSISYSKKALNLCRNLNYIYDNIFLNLQYLEKNDSLEYNFIFDNYQKLYNKKIINKFQKLEEIPKKIKVGYISPDFFQHSCSFFFLPLLENHNKEKFEIYCYYNNDFRDTLTKKIEEKADYFINISNLSLEDTLKIIKEHNLDILVDLAGHTRNNSLELIYYKPAKFVLNWLGFPSSTLLKNVDYKISDNLLTPENTQEFFTEKIYRLPKTSHCYKPLDIIPEIKTLPYIKNGYITFGSFNNISKISETTIELWSSVLSNLKNSQIIIKGNNLHYYSARKRLYNLFAKFGIDKKRVVLELPKSNNFEHLDFYNQIDLALDTFPYNGATTTLESLLMGVPVISLVGEKTASRYGLSFLSLLDMKDFACFSKEEFLLKAIEISNSIDKLKHLRFSLRENLLNSPLCDAKNFAIEMEKAYINILTSN